MRRLFEKGIAGFYHINLAKIATPFIDSNDRAFLRETMMGQNAIRFAALGLDERIFPCGLMPRRRSRSRERTTAFHND